MPYISTEEVKQVRQALKAALPNVKFSIRRDHWSTLQISIMRSNVDFGSKEHQINHFHYRNHEYSPEGLALIDKVMETIDSVHPRKEESYDGDYGSIPNYYLRLSIGKWDKPYEKI